MPIRREIASYIFLSTVLLRRFWLEVSVFAQKAIWRLGLLLNARSVTGYLLAEKVLVAPMR